MGEEYQAVNIKELVILIFKKWWLLVIIVFMTTSLSYWLAITYQVPVYRAQSMLFIGKDSSVLANINVNDLKFSNELVNDYRELMTSRLVTEEVINKLDFEIYHEQLIRRLNVFTVEGTRFMYITYDDTSRERAAYVANMFSEVLIGQAEEIVGVQNIRIVDYAIEPNNPININYMLTMTIGAIIGILITILVIFILMMADNTVKEKKFIEDIIGLPVLGKIPKFDGEEK